MTTKHTPAPWVQDQNEFYLTDSNNKFFGVEFDEYQVSDADMKLVSAAPDLLDALTDLFNDVMYLGIADECDDSFQKASRAIDKALGVSK